MVDGAADVPVNGAGWASTLSLLPETLAPSLFPYVFSATVIIAGDEIGGRPLLRRELPVFVEYVENSSTGEIDDGEGPPSPSAHRRTMFDGAEGLRLPSRHYARASMSPATVRPPVGRPKYVLRLATAGAGGWALEMSKPQPPASGRCRMWWDGWEAGGLVMAAMLECGGWIGWDADAYPLVYEFGLQYRYTCFSLCGNENIAKPSGRS